MESRVSKPIKRSTERLSENALQNEIKRIKDLGIKIKTNTPVDAEESVATREELSSQAVHLNEQRGHFPPKAGTTEFKYAAVLDLAQSLDFP